MDPRLGGWDSFKPVKRKVEPLFPDLSDNYVSFLGTPDEDYYQRVKKPKEEPIITVDMSTVRPKGQPIAVKKLKYITGEYIENRQKHIQEINKQIENPLISVAFYVTGVKGPKYLKMMQRPLKEKVRTKKTKKVFYLHKSFGPQRFYYSASRLIKTTDFGQFCGNTENHDWWIKRKK